MDPPRVLGGIEQGVSGSAQKQGTKSIKNRALETGASLGALGRQREPERPGVSLSNWDEPDSLPRTEPQILEQSGKERRIKGHTWFSTHPAIRFIHPAAKADWRRSWAISRPRKRSRVASTRR
jgi:hypothetical protein